MACNLRNRIKFLLYIAICVSISKILSIHFNQHFVITNQKNGHILTSASLQTTQLKQNNASTRTCIHQDIMPSRASNASTAFHNATFTSNITDIFRNQNTSSNDRVTSIEQMKKFSQNIKTNVEFGDNMNLQTNQTSPGNILNMESLQEGNQTEMQNKTDNAQTIFYKRTGASNITGIFRNQTTTLNSQITSDEDVMKEFSQKVKTRVTFSDFINQGSCPFFTRESNDSQPGQLLIMIISAPAHASKRMKIRNALNKSDLKARGGAFRFFLGVSMDNSTNWEMKKEIDMYQDVIQANFIDTYRNLTLKTSNMINWVDTHCGMIKFLLKMDDDIGWNLDFLFNVLNDLPVSSEAFVTGSCSGGVIAIRRKNSKWYITSEEYPDKQYPAYCYGPSYLMSRKAISQLHSVITEVPFFWLEDVFLTGIVRTKANVDIHYLNIQFFCHISIFNKKNVLWLITLYGRAF